MMKRYSLSSRKRFGHWKRPAAVLLVSALLAGPAWGYPGDKKVLEWLGSGDWRLQARAGKILERDLSQSGFAVPLLFQLMKANPNGLQPRLLLKLAGAGVRREEILAQLRELLGSSDLKLAFAAAGFLEQLKDDATAEQRVELYRQALADPSATIKPGGVMWLLGDNPTPEGFTLLKQQTEKYAPSYALYQALNKHPDPGAKSFEVDNLCRVLGTPNRTEPLSFLSGETEVFWDQRLVEPLAQILEDRSIALEDRVRALAILERYAPSKRWTPYLRGILRQTDRNLTTFVLNHVTDERLVEVVPELTLALKKFDDVYQINWALGAFSRKANTRVLLDFLAVWKDHSSTYIREEVLEAARGLPEAERRQLWWQAVKGQDREVSVEALELIYEDTNDPASVQRWLSSALKSPEYRMVFGEKFNLRHDDPLAQWVVRETSAQFTKNHDLGAGFLALRFADKPDQLPFEAIKALYSDFEPPGQSNILEFLEKKEHWSEPELAFLREVSENGTQLSYPASELLYKASGETGPLLANVQRLLQTDPGDYYMGFAFVWLREHPEQIPPFRDRLLDLAVSGEDHWMISYGALRTLFKEKEIDSRVWPLIERFLDGGEWQALRPFTESYLSRVRARVQPKHAETFKVWLLDYARDVDRLNREDDKAAVALELLPQGEWNPELNQAFSEVLEENIRDDLRKAIGRFVKR